MNADSLNVIEIWRSKLNLADISFLRITAKLSRRGVRVRLLIRSLGELETTCGICSSREKNDNSATLGTVLFLVENVRTVRIESQSSFKESWGES